MVGLVCLIIFQVTSLVLVNKARSWIRNSYSDNFIPYLKKHIESTTRSPPEFEKLGPVEPGYWDFGYVNFQGPPLHSGPIPGPALPPTSLASSLPVGGVGMGSMIPTSRAPV